MHAGLGLRLCFAVVARVCVSRLVAILVEAYFGDRIVLLLVIENVG